MKKIKKFLLAVAALVLALSMTACTVPSTYAAAVGFFAIDHRENFSDYFEQIKSAVRDAIRERTDDPETIAFAEDLFGLDSGINSEASEKDSSDDKKQTEESKTGDAEDDMGQKNSSEAQSGIQSPGSESESSSSSGSESDNPGAESQSKSGAPKRYIASPYVPDYEYIGIDEFRDLCGKFRQAGIEGNEKKTRELYEEVSQYYEKAVTMNAVAYINFSINVNDAYYQEESKHSDQLLEEFISLFMNACHDVCESVGFEFFSSLSGKAFAEEVKDYEPLSDKAIELRKKEQELINQYNVEVNNLDEISYELRGKTYTFNDLTDEKSALSLLAWSNYYDFIKVYEGLLEKANEKFGSIYVELLKIRGEIADEVGYDSFADYCYKENFGRKYTTKEAESYCNAIKAYVSKEYAEYAADSLYLSDLFSTEFTTDEMMGFLDSFTSEHNTLAHDSYTEFKSKQLYDIGLEDQRLDGSYTVILPSEKLPFVFCNIDNSLYGVSNLHHEFGHFVNQKYQMDHSDSPFASSNFDVFEIHSNVFELLVSNHYDKIVDNVEARWGQRFVLAVQLDSVIEGCIYDEFQRKVYENPDMTLDEINDLYKKVRESYEPDLKPGEEYMWVLNAHSFESPMYYLSYSISALSALEIWSVSQTDEAKAFDMWEKVIKEDDSEEYEKVMKVAGLTPFTDHEGAIAICKSILEQFK